MEEKSGVNTILLVVILLILVAGAVWWYKGSGRTPAPAEPENGLEIDIGYDSNQAE